MLKWSEFIPEEIEYDSDGDKLHAHSVTIEEACQCFFNPYRIRRNKKHRDRYRLLGATDSGRHLCVIFQVKSRSTVRVITGWKI